MSLTHEDAGMNVVFLITMPLRVEPWGERAFQVTDPNGVIVQLVDWNAVTDQ